MKLASRCHSPLARQFLKQKGICPGISLIIPRNNFRLFHARLYSTRPTGKEPKGISWETSTQQSISFSEFTEYDFFCAVERGDNATILAHYEQFKGEKGLGEESMVHLAVIHNHERTIRLLHDLGESINESNAIDFSPLDYAICFNRLNLIRLLVELGVDLNPKQPEGVKVEHERTPLIKATHSSTPEAVNLLLDLGANIHQTFYKNVTILSLCTKCSLENLKVLVERGADLMQKDLFHLTPIYHMIMHGNLENVKYLLDNDYVTVHPSLVFFAATRGDVDFFKYIMSKLKLKCKVSDIWEERSIDTGDLRDAVEFWRLGTPYLFANIRNPEIFDLLIEYGIPLPEQQGNQFILLNNCKTEEIFRKYEALGWLSKFPQVAHLLSYNKKTE